MSDSTCGWLRAALTRGLLFNNSAVFLYVWDIARGRPEVGKSYVSDAVSIALIHESVHDCASRSVVRRLIEFVRYTLQLVWEVRRRRGRPSNIFCRRVELCNSGFRLGVTYG